MSRKQCEHNSWLGRVYGSLNTEVEGLSILLDPSSARKASAMQEKLPERVGLGEAISNFYRHQATFRGRSSRSEWGYVLLFILIVTVGSILVTLVLPDLGSLLFAVFFIASILPSFSLTVRRLRDAGHSPYWLFITLVPFLGAIVLIVLCSEDSVYPEGMSLYDDENDIGQYTPDEVIAAETPASRSLVEDGRQGDLLAHIQKLQDLHERGLIDDEQLKAAKNKALGI